MPSGCRPRRRLRVLDAATRLSDLAALNSNRLEALKVTGKENIQSVSTSNGASPSGGHEAADEAEGK
jgi:hypothetical protein